MHDDYFAVCAFLSFTMFTPPVVSRATRDSLRRVHTLTRASPWIRPLKPDQPSPPAGLQDDFQLFPDFFSETEVERLIKMALWKLDRADSSRRRRGKGGAALAPGKGDQALFEDVKNYGFEEGHFDAVINHYRETLLSTLPPDSNDEQVSLMKRLYSLLPAPPPMDKIPPPNTTTHLLHLAPHGQILPHVDNVDASGSVIIGLSLGAERILRLESKGHGWEVLLKSGSVYRQKDSVRYKYEHSILSYAQSEWNGQPLTPGHRISLMVRDALPNPST